MPAKFPASKRPTKYRAQRTEYDGLSFASKAEARRYAELRLLERAGHITNLRVQPPYPLVVNGSLVGTYVADFAYHDTRTGLDVVEDVKAPVTRTAVYRLKAKLVKALHAITVTEVP